MGCGLWGAKLTADAESSLFVCNTRCRRRWQLNQLEMSLHYIYVNARVCVCGCGGKGLGDDGNFAIRSRKTATFQ